MDILILCTAIIIAILLIYGFTSNYFLRAEQYNCHVFGKDSEAPLKIVMLADLHGGTFGRKNERLIAKIKEEEPDLICIAGDMTVKNGKGTDICLSLCRNLLLTAPVYYAMGNHEIRMDCYDTYVEALRKAGVCVLDNEQKTVTCQGHKLCITGLNLDEYFYHKFWQKRENSAEIIGQYVGEPEPGVFQILLAHNPEYMEAYRQWGADLIFSGHVHGGIARLPLLGGVIDPSLRIFPKYDAGIFQKENTTMILSRGLGTHHIRLRFFNLPEISVINLD